MADKKPGNDHTSKVAFDTFGKSEDFRKGAVEQDPYMYCTECKCFNCNCDKKEESMKFTRGQIINRMVERGIDKKIIKLTLKEMESNKDLEAEEEKLGKDLDGDNEKGESKEHKAKVLGKK